MRLAGCLPADFCDLAAAFEVVGAASSSAFRLVMDRVRAAEGAGLAITALSAVLATRRI